MLARVRWAGSIVAVAIGAAYGAATSLVNDVSSPYGMLGGGVVGTGWAWTMDVAQFASLWIGAGWAWAGLAIAAGWLAGANLRAAVAAVLALLAATTTYYCLDSVLREEPLSLYLPELLQWWLASVVFGAALGVVGACIRRPGLVGLLAGLTLPVGATVQLILFGPAIMTPVTNFARVSVWVAAAVVAGRVITKFITGGPRRRNVPFVTSK